MIGSFPYARLQHSATVSRNTDSRLNSQAGYGLRKVTEPPANSVMETSSSQSSCFWEARLLLMENVYTILLSYVFMTPRFREVRTSPPISGLIALTPFGRVKSEKRSLSALSLSTTSQVSRFPISKSMLRPGSAEAYSFFM